ncbi:hypothetical protein G7Y79_00052g087370 [Physcia stellaris]|nr:hypothetical protein G7Y79_00052g087370 [Physcia stellaris]
MLFNQVVEDVVYKGPSTVPTQQNESRIGIVTWSPQSKESFFKSIENSNPRDLPAIARVVNTKSESEVNAFVHFLEEANVNQHVRGDRKALFDAAMIPAACEITDECDAALEEAADALALYQEREDEKKEMEGRGNHWLLTPKLAKEIDLCLLNDLDGENKVAETIPSAVLFDLKSFLHLSSRFFMNSSNQELNWRSFAEKRERPSIYYTAFSDIMNLVIAVTERLVQSALFLATSRLRSVDASGYHASRDVTRQDVRATLEILGMTPDTHAYWVGLARRCKLDVRDARGTIRKREVVGKRLSYNEVESILNERRNQNGQYSRSTSSKRSRNASPGIGSSSPISAGSTPDEEGSQLEETTEEDTPSSPALSDSKLISSSSKSLRSENRFDHDQVAYLSALDHHNSLEEEQRLWTLLDKTPLNSINPEAVQLPKKPGPERKNPDDLMNWRDIIDYGAEWETNDSPVPTGSFAENRATWKIRRRELSQWEDIERVDEIKDWDVSDSNADFEHEELSNSQSSAVRKRSVPQESASDESGFSTRSSSDLEAESDEDSLEQHAEPLNETSSSASFPLEEDGEGMEIDEVSPLTRLQPVSSLLSASGDSDDEGERYSDRGSYNSADSHPVHANRDK